MALTADIKDITIAQLAISVTQLASRAEDAEAMVAALQARIKELEPQPAAEEAPA